MIQFGARSPKGVLLQQDLIIVLPHLHRGRRSNPVDVSQLGTRTSVSAGKISSSALFFG